VFTNVLITATGEALALLAWEADIRNTTGLMDTEGRKCPF